MSGSLIGRRSEEMTQLKTSFPQGSEVPFESLRRRWKLKSARLKRCIEERRMEEEMKSVLLSVEKKQIGEA